MIPRRCTPHIEGITHSDSSKHHNMQDNNVTLIFGDGRQKEVYSLYLWNSSDYLYDITKTLITCTPKYDIEYRFKLLKYICIYNLIYQTCFLS